MTGYGGARFARYARFKPRRDYVRQGARLRTAAIEGAYADVMNDLRGGGPAR